MFTWLRPNDLVWNYVVNNYLLGKDPPAFDILYWNQDTVRLAAGLHRDFIHIALENSFTQPGALEVLGHAVDLRRVDVDSYVVAGAQRPHRPVGERVPQRRSCSEASARFVLVDAAATSRRWSTRRARDEPLELPGRRRVPGERRDVFSRRRRRCRGSWWPD